MMADVVTSSSSSTNSVDVAAGSRNGSNPLNVGICGGLRALVEEVGYVVLLM